MQNKNKSYYCIRENSHPMVMELGMLTKDALQEAIRLDDLKQRYSKEISSNYYFLATSSSKYPSN